MINQMVNLAIYIAVYLQDKQRMLSWEPEPKTPGDPGARRRIWGNNCDYVAIKVEDGRCLCADHRK